MSKNYNFNEKYDQRFEPEVEKKTDISTPIDPKPVVVSTKRTAVVLDNYYLNLRKDPSLDAAIITVLSPKTKLTVESEKDGWCKVKASNGKFGYVVSDYISK